MSVHWKRILLLLLMLALLASLPACAASNTITQAETDAWVARCIVDYDGLYQKNAIHYTQTHIYQNGGDERVLSNTQVWLNGSDSLEEYVNINEKRTYTVSVSGDSYCMQKKWGCKRRLDPPKDKGTIGIGKQSPMGRERISTENHSEYG